MFCLPPHTTHLTQPLDKGCFGPLKMFWREECHMYLSSDPGKVITCFQFSQLFSRSWFRGMTLTNVITGFRVTGVFPFDQYALWPQDPAEVKQKESLAERTGLKFIPLFTPKPNKCQCHPRTPTFSEDELACFQKCFEEGYDLKMDKRYNLWKQMYHPDNSLTIPHLLLYTLLPLPSHQHLCPQADLAFRMTKS